MKTFLCLILGILALSLQGCDPSQAATSATAATEEEHAHKEGAATYSEGKGLGLTEKARTTMGVATSEVATRVIQPKETFNATVFRGAGERAVAGRYQADSAYASIVLPAERATPLKTGEKFSLQTGGAEFTGKVSRIDHQMKEMAGQVEAIVEIPDPARKLVVGSSLTATPSSVQQKPDESVVIPESALLDTAKGRFVYVLNGEAYLRTPVEIGDSQDKWVQVRDGLFEGDVVVTEGTQNLYLAELQAVNAGTGCTHGH